MSEHSKQRSLDAAGVKDWREMSRLLQAAQRKRWRGEALDEREQRVWDVAMNTPPGSRRFA